MESKYFGGYSKTHYYYLLRTLGTACPPNENWLKEIPNVYPLLSDEDRAIFDSLPNESTPGYDFDDDSDTEQEYSDSEDESESPVNDSNEDALDELRYLVYRCGITVRATNLILKFRSKHSHLILPKTYKTLMKTPKVSVVPNPIGHRGQYVHRGIRQFFLNTKL